MKVDLMKALVAHLKTLCPRCRTPLGEVERLRARAARWKRAAKLNWGEDQSRALHADLNRRAATALGKPFEGPGSSWHDIPECITRLRERLRAAATSFRTHNLPALAEQCEEELF